jgi:hypothetical protein
VSIIKRNINWPFTFSFTSERGKGNARVSDEFFETFRFIEDASTRWTDKGSEIVEEAQAAFFNIKKQVEQ